MSQSDPFGDSLFGRPLEVGTVDADLQAAAERLRLATPTYYTTRPRPLGWIGVDLDGTLAEHHGGAFSLYTVGDPIPAMVERVKGWLRQGIEVRIVTARVADLDEHDLYHAVEAIQAWCDRHLGARLAVTCQKDTRMIALYDDRAIQVETNTGRLIGDHL